MHICLLFVWLVAYTSLAVSGRCKENEETASWIADGELSAGVQGRQVGCVSLTGPVGQCEVSVLVGEPVPAVDKSLGRVLSCLVGVVKLHCPTPDPSP